LIKVLENVDSFLSLFVDEIFSSFNGVLFICIIAAGSLSLRLTEIEIVLGAEVQV
jgi:hypothetical protein